MKWLKKIVVLIIGVGLSYGVWSNYTQQGFFAPNYIINNKTKSSPILIAHAGGLLRTGRLHLNDLSEEIIYHRSTNAKEAFYSSYEQGLRYMEGDLVFTADNQLILRHGWGEYLYELSGQEKPESVSGDREITLSEITDLSLFTYNHVMTGEDLITFLKEKRDATFILDIKSKDSNNDLRYKEVLQEICRLAENDTNILERIIPQAYQVSDLAIIKSIYPFKRVWLTLYKIKDSDVEILNAVSEGNVQGIVCGHDTYTNKKVLLSEVISKKIPVYVNTINTVEELDYYTSLGVSGVFTDTLRETENGLLRLGPDTLSKSY